jgi:hypothetical protein
MPKKRKKPATEMTTEEIAERVFPKKVRDEIHRVAEEIDTEKEKRSSRK